MAQQRPQYRYRPNRTGNLGDNARVTRNTGGLRMQESVVNALDMDGDGRVTMDDKREAFAKFDLDGDGRISRREILDSLEMEGQGANMRQATAIYNQLRGLNRPAQNYSEVQAIAEENIPARYRPRRVGEQRTVTAAPMVPRLDDDTPAPQPTVGRGTATRVAPLDDEQPAPQPTGRGSATRVARLDDDQPAPQPTGRGSATRVARLDDDQPAPQPTGRGQPDQRAPRVQVSERVQTAMDAIARMDRNGDGILTPQEVNNGMNVQARRGNLGLFDLNGDGNTTMQEVQTAIDKVTVSRADISKADLTRDGVVDRVEATVMLQQLDANRDGKVTMREAEAAAQKFNMNVSQLGAVLKEAGIQFVPNGRNQSAAVVPTDSPTVTAARDLQNNNNGRG